MWYLSTKSDASICDNSHEESEWEIVKTFIRKSYETVLSSGTGKKHAGFPISIRGKVFWLYHVPVVFLTQFIWSCSRISCYNLERVLHILLWDPVSNIKLHEWRFQTGIPLPKKLIGQPHQNNGWHATCNVELICQLFLIPTESKD